MRILPHLKEELGDSTRINTRYELVAELADGVFGLDDNPYEPAVFFSKPKGKSQDLGEAVVPKDGQCGVLDAMDRLAERVVSRYGISPNEVKMRLALRGGGDGLE